MNTVFSHRRPLAHYLKEHNPDMENPISLWFTRARWFSLGIAFAALIVAMVSV